MFVQLAVRHICIIHFAVDTFVAVPACSMKFLPWVDKCMTYANFHDRVLPRTQTFAATNPE